MVWFLIAVEDNQLARDLNVMMKSHDRNPFVIFHTLNAECESPYKVLCTIFCGFQFLYFVFS